MALSFGPVMDAKTSEPHRKFIELIKAIPIGRVATYGQIAKLASEPGHARQVVRTLHSSSKKYKLPWHRVINSKGQIGLPDEMSFLKQKTLLQREGVSFKSHNQIDLTEFLWNPTQKQIKSVLKKV